MAMKRLELSNLGDVAGGAAGGGGTQLPPDWFVPCPHPAPPVPGPVWPPLPPSPLPPEQQN
jgi:hypothetical protein